MKKSKKHLSSEAIADGSKSGLSKNDMHDLGMYSLPPKETYAMFGIQSEAIAMPYDKNGTFVRAKILSQTTKFGAVINRKYTQRKGTTPKIYLPNIGEIKWNKVAKDKSQPLYITEGEKKAASACKAGYPCIGLAGVYCFRSKQNGFLPDWDKFELDGREVFIIFDSDIIDKPQVRWAEYALSLELTARGAHVSRIRLLALPNNDKCGLDDFLVANGLPSNIDHAKKEFAKLPREKIDAAYPPHLTELGNAIRFEYTFKNQLRYVPEMGNWVAYNRTSGLWKQDKDGEAMRCAKMLPYALKKEIEKTDDANIKKAYFKWAKTSQSEKNLTATLKLASTEAGLLLNEESIDADHWRIAFNNGKAFNLKTLEVIQTTPDDFFMKSMGTLYDPKSKCPRWETFINEIMAGDRQLVEYLQRIVGWCLSGDMSEQCFFVLFGIGANGKSTFLNTLLELFGAYGRQASPQTFMVNKHESNIRSDLVRLQGIRFIATSETENHQRISESLIKQWTGGEKISTRDLYKTTFEFTPQGKIFLATNHKPRIHGDGHAIWRRVQLIPFTRTFTDADKDLNLQDTLKTELPGILNWALKGHKEWQKKGLQAPPSVISAVKAYREDMDAIGSWMKENCQTDKTYQGLIGSLYDNYRAWTKDSEEYTLNKRDFVRQMEERGFEKLQTTKTHNDGSRDKGWVLKGLCLDKDHKKFEKALTPKPRK